MNTELNIGLPPEGRRSLQLPLSALVTGLGLLSSGLSQGAEPAAGGTINSAAPSASTANAAASDPSVAELKAENERLKQALRAAQNQLAAQSGAARAAVPVEPVKTLTSSASPAASAAIVANAAPMGSVTILTSAVAPAADADAAASGGGGDLTEVVIDASRERLTGRSQALDQLRDVPISISVVSGVDLETEDAFDIGAITKRVADVSWNQGNQRTSSISIRGVGKIGQNEAQDPSVGVTVDDVSYAFNPLTSSINFTDLDQVDVLRGPQGTAGGKNDTLGTINIQVRQPGFDPESNYLLALGERDTFIGQYAGGGAVIPDLLAFRGTISVDKGQGDIKKIGRAHV